MTRIKQLLIEAREFLASHHWCQGSLGRRLDGTVIDPSQAYPAISDLPTVDAVCAAGAIRAVPGYDTTEQCQAMSVLTCTVPGYHVNMILSAWNDNPLRTKAEVLVQFDVAIATILEEPGCLK